MQLRVTVGARVPLADAAIPDAERDALAAQAAAHLTAHGGRRRITTAFPIRVLAIEDVEYDE